MQTGEHIFQELSKSDMDQEVKASIASMTDEAKKGRSTEYANNNQ